MNNIISDSCESWNECKALKRICYAMRYWEELYRIPKLNQNHEQQFKLFIGNRYQMFRTDFQHLFNYHKTQLEQVPFISDFCYFVDFCTIRDSY